MNLKELLVDFGTRCNNDCVFCRRLDNVVLRLKDFHNFESLVENAQRVDVTGTGEFTLHPDFYSIVDLLTAAGKPFRLVSNGTTMDHELVEYLDKSTLNELCISLNSLDRQTYLKLCGRDHFDKVMRNVVHIAGGENSFEFFVSFVMTTLNLDELPRIVDFAKQHGVIANCMDLTPTIKDYPEGLLIPDTPENREKIRVAQVYSYDIGAKVGIFRLETRGSGPTDPLGKLIRGCRWPHETMCIQTTGNAVPCCWCQVPMGNIRVQTAEEIWSGVVYADLRKCIAAGDIKYCKNCRGFG